ncbi:VOC family protein [Flexivirga alba]|uniref:VOC family protein n=1 Tax=Flexivirga alba TaxID=702742 RepID=A0ABW2AKY8_9MICO
MQLTIDAVSRPEVMRFWQVVLGYDEFGDEDLIDPFDDGPWLHFQQMDEPRQERNRLHLDLYLPQEEAEARVAAVVEAGGRIVNDAKAPLYWTLADPEGNEVDIAPWPDSH